MSPGPHTLVVNAMDNAGNAHAISSTFAIIVSANSLSNSVEQLLASGAIGNAGVANSLMAKLSGNPTRNNLNAFLNELDAQLNQKITQQAYDILRTAALSLLATLP